MSWKRMTPIVRAVTNFFSPMREARCVRVKRPRVIPAQKPEVT